MPAFLVRASDDHRAAALPVREAANPIEAAIAFAEQWGGTGEAAVTVVDCETGREQCFRIDLEDHSAAPC